MFLLLFFLVILLYILYSWLSFLRDLKTIGAPGPLPLPIFGNGLMFLGDSSSKYLPTYLPS